MRISYLIAALTTFIVCAIGNTENYNAFAAACQHNSINPDALDTRYRYAIFDMSPPRTAVAQCYPGFTHMEVVVGRIVTVAGGRDFQATLFDLVIDENGKAAANSEPWQANYHLGPEGDWRPNRSQHTWSVAGKGQVLPEYDDNYIHNIGT
ncbi:MAG: hypothetical protein CL912_12495 [Deltaproteobacteria bacterium]|nr:hypothetical protein [Deltaproteobacteria bacterium]|tara:strand:- start:251 stop:703 length:453 start_codon:yes stop_codon:yes gene_type:complete